MTAHVLSLCALQNALVALFGSSACCSALRVFCVLTMSSRKKKRPFELCPCEYPPTGLCLCQWHPSRAQLGHLLCVYGMRSRSIGSAPGNSPSNLFSETSLCRILMK